MLTVILDIISAMILAIISTVTGWWFGTFFIFHNIWDHPSHWLSYFLRWLKLPTSLYLPFYSPLWYNYIHHYIDHYIYILLTSLYLAPTIIFTPFLWFPRIPLAPYVPERRKPRSESGRCGRAERMGLAISIATSWGDSVIYGLIYIYIYNG